MVDFCTGLETFVRAATVGVTLPPGDDLIAALPVCTAFAEFFLRLVDVRSSFCKSVSAVSVATAVELAVRNTIGASAELVPKNRIRNGWGANVFELSWSSLPATMMLPSDWRATP